MPARRFTRRRWMLAASLWPATLALRAQAAGGAELPAAADLPGQLQAAVARGQALVLMVSLHGCPFCKVARESYLAPLRRETGQPAVQLDMQSGLAVLDLQGRRTTHGALVRALDVRVAPTVLFLGRGGKEVAPRLVGASIPDFYGAYLEERVRTANQAVSGTG